MNELCEYTKNLIQERYHITPTIITKITGYFYLKWDGNTLLVNYININFTTIPEIRILYHDTNHMKTVAVVNNLLEAYRYITLLINRIAPYKLQ
jgi:hypothetical protein